MLTIFIIPLLAAMFLAVNMGGSGTAPAFSAAFGSNLIRKDLIPGIFGLFVFAGAILAGGKVVLTLGKGILPGEYMNLTLTTIILLSVSLSILFANILKVPQSTSQSTVFALMGTALYFNVLKTNKLFFEIIPTWFITPVLAFGITYIAGKFALRFFKFSNTYKSISKHKYLKYLVLLGAAYVSFAIGSNNVANAAGPIVSMASNIMGIPENSVNFPIIVLIVTLMLAPCFGMGSSFMGHRVLVTSSKEIVDFGPLGAVLISIVTASLLLAASLTKGIPTSLVQMNIGAIIALRIVKFGSVKIFSETPLKKILTIWIVSPIVAFTLAYCLTFIADKTGIM